MTPDVFAWDVSSNNRAYVWGRASVIQNAITACRSAEQQNPDLAGRTALAPPPAGPRERLGPVGFLHGYVLWKSSPRAELARRFLVDLVAAGAEALAASRLVNLPAFPRAAGDLRARLAADRGEPGRYALLADAERWSAGPGHPGHLTPAVEEAVHRGVIARMFARAARGEVTAEAAVRDADAELRRLAGRWQP
jgi:multiple sugar transport system substrate-binding protein